MFCIQENKSPPHVTVPKCDPMYGVCTRVSVQQCEGGQGSLSPPLSPGPLGEDRVCRGPWLSGGLQGRGGWAA